MECSVLPFRGVARRSLGGILAAAVLGLGACSAEPAAPGPNLPGNPPSNPQLRQAAFIFDVNTRTGKVKVSSPAVNLSPSVIGLWRGSSGSEGGPSYSILGSDVIAVTTANFFASEIGAITPNKVRVSFDVQVINKLTGIDLVTSTFPVAPAGETGVILFPFSTNVTTTSGGVGVEDDNVVVVELPSRGEVQPGNDWNGGAALDQPVFPASPGAGGEPHNFFNDANCPAVVDPANPSDCYRYETFGVIGSAGISGARRVGFDIDGTVGEFRVRMIAVADLRPAGATSGGTVSGTVSSPQRGPLAGVTVALQGVAGTQTTDAAGQYSFTNVGVGSRSVTLTIPAALDCSTITPANGQVVTVTSGATLTQDYSVTCSAQTASVGATISRTGAGTQSLAGISYAINPDFAGLADLTGTVSGSGASVSIPSTSVPLGVSGGAGFGSGVIQLGNLPADCSVANPAGTYGPLAPGDAATVVISVSCDAPPPPPAMYIYTAQWGAVSGGQVDLVVKFNPENLNDPVINGAGADNFAGMQGIIVLTGSAAARLTAVSGVATGTFATPTIGGSLPTISWLTFSTTPPTGYTNEQSVATFRFTVGVGAAGSVTTSSSLSEVSTPDGDAFPLSGNLTINEATLNLP